MIFDDKEIDVDCVTEGLVAWCDDNPDGDERPSIDENHLMKQQTQQELSEQQDLVRDGVHVVYGQHRSSPPIIKAAFTDMWDAMEYASQLQGDASRSEMSYETCLVTVDDPPSL